MTGSLDGSSSFIDTHLSPEQVWMVDGRTRCGGMMPSFSKALSASTTRVMNSRACFVSRTGHTFWNNCIERVSIPKRQLQRHDPSMDHGVVVECNDHRSGLARRRATNRSPCVGFVCSRICACVCANAIYLIRLCWIQSRDQKV